MPEDLSHLRESLRRSFSNIKEDILSQESKIKKIREENKRILLSIQKISSELKKKASSQSKTHESNELTSLKSQISSIKRTVGNLQQPDELESILSKFKKLSKTINQKIKKIEERVSDIEPKHTPPPKHQEKFESFVQRLDEKISALSHPNTNKPNIYTESQIHSIVGDAVKQAVSSLNMPQQRSHQKETETPFAQKMVKKIVRNKKGIIKQRIIDILSHSPMLLPELKDAIVDENKYCSKASFYRYIEELTRKGIIAFSKKKDTNLVMLKDKSYPS